MNTEKLTKIKSLCQRVLELDEKATIIPWVSVDSETGDDECDETCNAIQTPDGMLDGDNLIADSSLIAFYRNFSPSMAKAILETLEYSDSMKTSSVPWITHRIIQKIADSFPDEFLNEL
jgi:hypothetical protein